MMQILIIIVIPISNNIYDSVDRIEQVGDELSGSHGSQCVTLI